MTNAKRSPELAEEGSKEAVNGMSVERETTDRPCSIQEREMCSNSALRGAPSYMNAHQR